MQFKIQDDHLVTDIEVFGVAEDLQRKVTGVIDTGFNGYLSLPFVTAFPIGLILKGQQTYTMADGSLSNYLVCLGTVTFQGRSVVVPIDVQPSGPVLIGVQLLKKLDLEMKVQFSKSTFELAHR
jgi:clan AA aspartic protease